MKCITLLFGLIAVASASQCWCGWFVQTMYPGLSNLDPLEFLYQDSWPEMCDFAGCTDECAIRGAQQGVLDLDEDVGGQPRGQLFCKKVADLIGEEVDSDNLFVLARVPDCDDFFVWGTNRTYTSETQLCCTGGNYFPCAVKH